MLNLPFEVKIHFPVKYPGNAKQQPVLGNMTGFSLPICQTTCLSTAVELQATVVVRAPPRRMQIVTRSYWERRPRQSTRCRHVVAYH